MLRPDHRLALFMERAFDDKTGKMGLAVLRYSTNEVVCVVDSTHAGSDLRALTGIDHPCPIVATVDEAKALGADVLILGIAPPGGLIPTAWWPAIRRAAELGLSLVNGLHDGLEGRVGDLAPGQFVWEVRREPPEARVGTAAARLLDNRRVLMIGTDMSVGKMTAGLEIARFCQQKVSTSFVATGQVGIVVTGGGVALDAVRLDFAAGAVESEVLKCSASKLVVIEGQGSVIHPGSSATLPLLRGSCPTHLVLCHRAGMTHLPRAPWVQVPPLKEVIDLYERLAHAAGVFPPAKVVAVALNTGHLDGREAAEAIRDVESETGLPSCDPVRDGAQKLVDAVLA